MDKNKKIAIAAAIVLIIIVAIIVFLISRNTTIYTVSFGTSDGELVSIQKVKKGNAVEVPEEPVKEGYEFVGWYIGDELYDFSKIVEKDMVLTAKWKIKEQTIVYTITIENDGQITTLETDELGLIEEPVTPSKEGYIFLGWYIEDEKVDFSKPFTSDVTITAKWEKEEEKTTNNTQKPVKPQKTAEAQKPAETTKPVETSKPAETTKPAQTQKPVETTKPAETQKPEDVISYTIENVFGSTVNQVNIFVLKNNVKVDGIVTITTSTGKVVTKEIPASGYMTNGGNIKSITNVRVK